MRGNFTRYGGFRCFARLIGKVRIIAANARTAAGSIRALSGGLVLAAFLVILICVKSSRIFPNYFDEFGFFHLIKVIIPNPTNFK